jgi:DNA gyrase subunit A
LLEGEQLIGAVLTDGQSDVMLVSSGGKAIRFGEQALRPMGRSARGVRGIRLKDGQNVIALIPISGEGTLVIATANGYGKRTLYSEFPVKGRGGQGVIAIQANDRNGDVIGAGLANVGEDIMLITGKGILVRTPAAEISVIGRNTQGLRLIALKAGEQLIGLETIPEIIDIEENPTLISSPGSDEIVN